MNKLESIDQKLTIKSELAKLAVERIFIRREMAQFLFLSEPSIIHDKGVLSLPTGNILIRL